MPLTVNHVFSSTRATSSDPTIVSHDQWNSSHAVSGTVESSNVTGLGPFTANQVIYASSIATAAGMTGTTWSDANQNLTISGVAAGTVTTPVLSINQTWNALSNFTAFKLNATHLTAGAGSLLFDIQKDTNSFLNLDVFGTMTMANGLRTHLVINSGTPQAAVPIIDLSQTWNNGAFTYFGLNMNVTNTLSGANSRLVSLTVSASQVFAIDVTGAIVKGTIPSSQLTGTLTSSQIVSIGSSQLSTTVPASQGGTGLTTYTVGDLVVASSANLLVSLSDAATGNALISGGAGAAPTYGKIGLGTHVSGAVASSQVVSIGSSQLSTQIGSTQLAVPFTVGFTLTPYTTGTVSAGTFTPNPVNGNYQYYTNGGAHTLAASTADSAIDILMYNSSSAGAVTFSGFTVSSNTGDALTTISSNRFLLSLRRINAISLYSITALQ